MTGTAETGAAVQEPAAVVQAVAVEAQAAPPVTLPGGFAPLWTVADVAHFLQRSERFIYDALTRDPAQAGSIPFIRIPGGRGSHGQGSPRFVPASIQEWVAAGCPPAAVFQSWQEAGSKKRRKSV
jgi:hypothetical protein